MGRKATALIYLDRSVAGIDWLLDPASEELAAQALDAEARGTGTPCDAGSLAEDAPLLRRLIAERHFGVATGRVAPPDDALAAWETLLARGVSTWGDAVRELQAALRRALVDEHVRVVGAADRPAPDGPAVEEREVDGVLVLRIRRLMGDPDDERALAAWSADADRHFAHDRIVVDLRDNPGGNDGHTFRWIERRLRATPGYATDSTWVVRGAPLGNWNAAAWREALHGRGGVPPALLAGRHEPRPGDAIELHEETYDLAEGDRPWRGRMVVLVNRRSRSSGESSAWLLKRGLGAVIAGEPSRGMIEYGNIVPYLLPRSGLVVQLPTKANDFGFRVEGVGFPVDVPLDPDKPVEQVAAEFDRIAAQVASRLVAYEFKLPDLGEGLTEGEIAKWLVAEGEEIAEDAPLVEIQTDKTTVEIPSPAAGIVSKILVAEGDVVPVGTVLVVIGGDTSHPSPPAEQPEASNSLLQAPGTPAAVSGGRVQATPLVRRIAQELGVDLESVAPTGPGGRLSEGDVRNAARGASNSLLQAPEGRREPVRGVRRQIVEHLTRAHREVPAVTYVEECDFSGLDLKLLLPTVLRATAAALQEFPELNARLEGNEIVYLDRYDIGVAMQTDAGLVVPVVRDCDTRSVEELRAAVDELAAKARAGSLTADELRGSTFTVTSAGKLAGVLVTPLVNHPEVGILGVHRIGPRPAVRDDQVVVRQMGNISVTFDHRVVDGARAAQFTLAVIDRLQARAS